MDTEIIVLHLRKLVRDLDVHLSKKIITEKEYNKGMVTLAYEYSMLGLSDEALLTFINVKTDYFKNDGIKDIGSDQEFYQKCDFLLAIFDYIEVVPIDILCNSPPAEA
jgi:hypothetical protein